jgi:dienelactone hydrolase
MHETPILFGPDEHLLGVITAPQVSPPVPVGCLLMNAGVVHRIGPHRLNVKVARALAARGVVSLRMDLSGLGDSEPARGGGNYRDQAVEDVQAAMDFLERAQGLRRFVVVGICSGAVNAYWTALADSRIVGLLMFDGFAYPTAKTALVRRWTSLHHMSWPQLAGQAWSLARRFITRAHDGEGPDSASASPKQPSREEFRTAMDTLVARGVSVYLVYSHAIKAHNYAGQLRDAFRGASFLRTIRYDYIPHIDHTVTPIAAQREFVETISGWVADVIAVSPQRAPSRTL